MELIRHADGVAVSAPGGALVLRHIIGIGMNYAAHAQEQGKGVPTRPVLFTKNPLSAALHGDDIVVPKACQERPQVDWECELAVIIGTRVRDVSPADALTCVLGYTCGNDVSARWWQKDGSGGQFYRGKSFDTFCPLGPRVVPAAEIPDPQGLRLGTRVNGVTMQDSSTGDMIFGVAALIAEISRGTTIPAGTVIMTGTPSGVGFARQPAVYLQDGDVVEIEVEKIGVLRNRVRFER